VTEVGPAPGLTLADLVGPSTSLAVAPDGTVLSGSAAGSILVFAPDEEDPARRLTGHTGGVLSVAVTADGRTAVSAGDDGTVRVWDLTTGTETRALTGHTDWVRSVAVTADGRTAVSAGDDGTVRVWDLTTGTEITPGRVQVISTTVPGLASDDRAETDHLGFGTEVHALARVLASKQTAPPLAVALLGDWGSGKSSFMHQLMQELERVEEIAKSTDGTPFCGRLLHVEFNAWHYADTHLWSGLVARLFEQLRKKLPDQEDALRLVDEDELRDEMKRLRHRRQDIDRQIELHRLAKSALDRLPFLVRRQAWPRTLAGLGAGARVTVGELKDSSQKLRRWTLGALVVFLLLLCITALLWLRGRVTVAVVSGIVSTAAAVAVPLLRWTRKRLQEICVGLGSSSDDEDEVHLAELLARRRAIADRLGSLEAELAETDPERRLTRFLAERSSTTDYAAYRGLVELVRRDLDALKEHLDDDTRIIVYVDDLDRCEPQRVVELLAAVHLMVAYPHVVVIVAVDARWLLTSLRHHYRELLAAADESELGSYESTPIEYLEKIFQIAVAVPPSGDLGSFFGALLPVDADAGGGAAGTALDTSPSGTAPAPVAGQTQSSATDQADGSEQQGVGLERDWRSDKRLRTSSPALPPPREVISIRDVLVHPQERAFAERLGPLLRTPRTAKRLANVYRVVRGAVAPDRLDGYLTDKEYEAVLVLLAIVLGRPLASPEIFGRLADPANETLQDALESGVPADADQQRPPGRDTATGAALADDYLPIGNVEETLADLRSLTLSCPDLEVYRRWLPVIARYSFRHRELTRAIRRGQHIDLTAARATRPPEAAPAPPGR
jgi:hypothetical protein